MHLETEKREKLSEAPCQWWQSAHIRERERERERKSLKCWDGWLEATTRKKRPCAF